MCHQSRHPFAFYTYIINKNIGNHRKKLNVKKIQNKRILSQKYNKQKNINKTEYNNLSRKMSYIAMLKCILYTYSLRDGIDVIGYKSSRLM